MQVASGQTSVAFSCVRSYTSPRVGGKELPARYRRAQAVNERCRREDGLGEIDLESDVAGWKGHRMLASRSERLEQQELLVRYGRDKPLLASISYQLGMRPQKR